MTNSPQEKGQWRHDTDGYAYRPLNNDPRTSERQYVDAEYLNALEAKVQQLRQELATLKTARIQIDWFEEAKKQAAKTVAAEAERDRLQEQDSKLVLDYGNRLDELTEERDRLQDHVRVQDESYERLVAEIKPIEASLTAAQRELEITTAGMQLQIDSFARQHDLVKEDWMQACEQREELTIQLTAAQEALREAESQRNYLMSAIDREYEAQEQPPELDMLILAANEIAKALEEAGRGT